MYKSTNNNRKLKQKYFRTSFFNEKKIIFKIHFDCCHVNSVKSGSTLTGVGCLPPEQMETHPLHVDTKGRLLAITQ